MTPTWRSAATRLFEYIERTGMDPDTTYSYHELSAVVEQDITKNRSPVYQAIPLLEKQHKRTLVVVPTVGYRVAAANESPGLARRRVTRSQGQIRKGLHTARHTDESRLTQEERHELHRCQQGLEALRQEMARVKRRMGVVEGRLDELEAMPTLTAEEIQLLKSLIGR